MGLITSKPPLRKVKQEYKIVVRDVAGVLHPVPVALRLRKLLHYAKGQDLKCVVIVPVKEGE